MDDDQQFCLRWNNHQSTLVSVFDTLLEKGMHVDCTLAAEGQTLKAHKVVLSACSPYFESVLSQQYDKHPIIILKDVKYAELRAMMDYMYRGEVNISQDQLAALLKAAESLQIKGLSDNKPTRPPSRPPQPASTHTQHTQHSAHPPRPTSPHTQVRDGSVDSREGSVSPSRRRKKARRISTEVPSATTLPVNTDSVQAEDMPLCKEETHRDGVEDLTLDEDQDEHPPTPHNDVVRNFQWHMERSQDEIMNSSDSVRESQGKKTSPRQTITTRSKNVTEDSGNVTTLAILKTVKSPKNSPEDCKENKRQEKPPLEATSQSGQTTSQSGQVTRASGGGGGASDGDTRYMFPRSERSNLSCAQYKTDKGYKCPNCQRSYNARKNLVRHVTLECGREPQYKCPHCSYSKHRRNELKKHIEKKHSALAVN